MNDLINQILQDEEEEEKDYEESKRKGELWVGKRVPLPVGAQKGDSLINFKNKKIGCYLSN